MKTQINQEALLEELLGIWPKQTNDLDRARDRFAFLNKITTADAWELVKNHVECLIEDTSFRKLPHLSDVINGLFKATPKLVQEISINPVLNKEGLYQKTDNPELVKTFDKIWEVWPRVPHITESRRRALAAFLDRVKVFPLDNLKRACLSYASAFGDGSLIYPKIFRRWLEDQELIEEWLERSIVSKENEVIRKQFEAAYAWYPIFSNKNTDKVREASWVMYWRCIKPEEKLDFLAAVQLYRRQRKADWNSSDQPEEELINYTKSFASFVGEFRQMLSGGRIWESKAGIFAQHAIAYAKENGVDLNNIWGQDVESYFIRVLTYYCSTCPNIKTALKEGFLKTVSVVKEVKEDPKKHNDIIDLEKAIKEGEWLEKKVDSFTDLIYNKVCEVRLYELPQEVKND